MKRKIGAVKRIGLIGALIAGLGTQSHAQISKRATNAHAQKPKQGTVQVTKTNQPMPNIKTNLPIDSKALQSRRAADIASTWKNHYVRSPKVSTNTMVKVNDIAYRVFAAHGMVGKGKPFTVEHLDRVIKPLAYVSKSTNLRTEFLSKNPRDREIRRMTREKYAESGPGTEGQHERIENAIALMSQELSTGERAEILRFYEGTFR